MQRKLELLRTKPHRRFSSLQVLELHIDCEDSNIYYDACPIEALRVVQAYCTNAYSSISTLRLRFKWSQATPEYNEETSVIIDFDLEFLEELEDLDDNLSDAEVFPALKQVELDMRPVLDSYKRKTDERLALLLRDRLRLEALEVFSETAARVVDFQVVTQEAFT